MILKDYKRLRLLVFSFVTSSMPSLSARTNFFMFLWGSNWITTYLFLTKLKWLNLASLKKVSLFSSKTTTNLRNKNLFFKSVVKKTFKKTTQARHVCQLTTRQGFWRLTTYLHHNNFDLIGPLYRKRQFNFDEKLNQNRVNPSLKLSKLRRNVFNKLRKLKTKFFFTLLKNNRLSVCSKLKIPLTNVRLKVRRSTRLRKINPYLFLSKRPQRISLKSTGISYLLIKTQQFQKKKKSVISKRKITKRRFKTKTSFFFWKKYLNHYANPISLKKAKFFAKWYRWKLLSTRFPHTRGKVRRVIGSRSLWRQVRKSALDTTSYFFYKQSLLRSFMQHSCRRKSIVKRVSQTTSISSSMEPLIYKQGFTQLKKLKAVPLCKNNLNIPSVNVVSTFNFRQPLFKHSKVWALRKKWKRRSSQRRLVLLTKVNKLFGRFLKTKLHWSLRKSTINQPSVKLVQWYKIFWRSSTRTKPSFNINLQPIARFMTSSSRTVSQLWFSTHVEFKLKSLVKQTSFFCTLNKPLLSNITRKTSTWIKHNWSSSRHSLQSNFGQTFVRNMYFFTYILQMPLPTQNLDSKISFLQSNYTFANTTSLKRLIIRRFIRDAFYFKNSFHLTNSNHTGKLFSNEMRFYQPGSVKPINSQNIFRKITLPIYTNSRITRIPRVRFKPGYARQWRFFRSDVKSFLQIKVRYQYRLTILIHRLFSSEQKSLQWNLQVRITPLLVQSRLLPDFWSASETLNAHSVYVNGVLCLNPQLNLFFSDFLQLIISVKHYIVNKWLLNWGIRRSARIMQLNRRWSTKKSTTSFTKPKPLPHWVFNVRYSNYDVPTYLEIDFFTLSAFIVLPTQSLRNVTASVTHEPQYKIFNMYNWKYIT